VRDTLSAAVVLLAACTRPVSAPVAPGVPAVFSVACSATCADALAHLTVYRDDAGSIGLVTVQGSPQACSDAPVLFFGPDGSPREGLPFGVVSGTAEAERAHTFFEAQTRGLHKAETPLCRDVVPVR
jgi:hypothetical protein